MIRVGCCGFPVARERYFKKFSVVEVQSTFYDFVEKKTLERWRKDSPCDFEFVLKAFQFITHQANSPTYNRAKHLGNLKQENLGGFKPNEDVLLCFKILKDYARILNSRVIIFQTPASFTPEGDNKKNMEKFFNRIDRKDLLFGWEARGKWTPDAVKKVCEDLELIDVVDPFLREPTYGKIFYYRLHGGKGYRHKFTDDELRMLAEKVKGRDGYVMFNNITSFEDALRFKRLLTQ